VFLFAGFLLVRGQFLGWVFVVWGVVVCVVGVVSGVEIEGVSTVFNWSCSPRKRRVVHLIQKESYYKVPKS